jgi:hypothetical protein
MLDTSLRDTMVQTHLSVEKKVTLYFYAGKIPHTKEAKQWEETGQHHCGETSLYTDSCLG